MKRALLLLLFLVILSLCHPTSLFAAEPSLLLNGAKTIVDTTANVSQTLPHSTKEIVKSSGAISEVPKKVENKTANVSKVVSDTNNEIVASAGTSGISEVPKKVENKTANVLKVVSHTTNEIVASTGKSAISEVSKIVEDTKSDVIEAVFKTSDEVSNINIPIEDTLETVNRVITNPLQTGEDNGLGDNEKVEDQKAVVKPEKDEDYPKDSPLQSGTINSPSNADGSNSSTTNNELSHQAPSNSSINNHKQRINKEELANNEGATLIDVGAKEKINNLPYYRKSNSPNMNPDQRNVREKTIDHYEGITNKSYDANIKIYQLLTHGNKSQKSNKEYFPLGEVFEIGKKISITPSSPGSLIKVPTHSSLMIFCLFGEANLEQIQVAGRGPHSFERLGDQWINGPPFEPPKTSFFSLNEII